MNKKAGKCVIWCQKRVWERAF